MPIQNSDLFLTVLTHCCPRIGRKSETPSSINEKDVEIQDLAALRSGKWRWWNFLKKIRACRQALREKCEGTVWQIALEIRRNLLNRPATTADYFKRLSFRLVLATNPRGSFAGLDILLLEERIRVAPEEQQQRRNETTKPSRQWTMKKVHWGACKMKPRSASQVLKFLLKKKAGN